MKFYIDNTEDDIVRIKGWGDINPPVRSQTIELCPNKIEKKKMRIFEILKHEGDTRRPWCNISPEIFQENKGKFLVFYKEYGIIDWNPTQPYIKVSVDIEDTLIPYDGIPDMVADGSNYCYINVKKYSSTGNILNRSKDNNLIEFKATSGTLEENKKRMTLGECRVKLITDKVYKTRQVKITAFMGEKSDSIVIQFAPRDLYE